MLTTDPNDPGLRKTVPGGQQETYLILSEEERAKGFVMPVYRSYRHVKCGCDTHMGQALCETYARDPKFYGGTFCCHCGTHFPLVTAEGPQFFWVENDGDRGPPVGSGPEEAAAYFAEKVRRDEERKAEATRRRVSQLLDELEAEGIQSGPGLRCPKCGGQMAHYRLHGYRCLRGCQ